MRIYNTLTKRKEELKTSTGKVQFFVCGPTVYDAPHLGNAKTYTQFDGIVRYLRKKGYEVFYLQNITDIDDKIIQRAQERGIAWSELAREFEAVYLEDMKALHNISVTKYARATEYIPQIVQQVKTLLEKGYAYRTKSGVYYDVAKFADYGKLSGRTQLKKEDSVSRIDESEDKKNWNDFCLWKAYKLGEPAWETELGKGRPGWHIEDTAITETVFGPQYDMHGGAVDLIFPHHEAEIAQMEAAGGKVPFVRYWLHTGLLNMNGEKMSKSKGNFRTIREALGEYDFRILRFFFLSAYYRKSLDFSVETLEQAKNGLRRIEEFIFKIDSAYDDRENIDLTEQCKKQFYQALDDDFNTPQAFAALFDGITQWNTRKKKLGKHVYDFFREVDEVFDILAWQKDTNDEKINAMIAERNELRKKKDFTKADALRRKLEGMGIQVYDTPEGVKWRKVK